ncbi:MAG: hypothetical protein PHF86_14960 [Candidatus Nanoarchaeia archaeon]|nr:hypothetical protein [Candidatus Nanoarchaeia archaeon]
MSFLDFYELNEVTADQKYDLQYKNKLDRNQFNLAVELDPTSKGQEKVGKYVDWIIKNKLFDKKPEEMKDLLSKYEKFKSKLEINQRDINKLKYEDVVGAIDTLIQKGALVSQTDKEKERKKQAEKEAEMAYQDDDVIVIIPKTMFASQYFGAGSDWCTARQDDKSCMFDSYDRDGTLYIVKDKHDNKKYQLYVEDENKKYEYRDSANKSIDPFHIFSEYRDFMEWLEEKEFPNQGKLTEEQRDGIARNILNGLDIEDITDEEERDAIDMIKTAFSGYEEMYEDGDANVENMESAIEDITREWDYYFEAVMDILQSKYGIDSSAKENKLLLIPYIGELQDLEYDLRHERDNYSIDSFDPDKIHDFQWKYLSDMELDKMIDSLDINFEDKEGLSTEELNTIEQWLTRKYNTDHETFISFMDDLNDIINSGPYKTFLSKEIEKQLKDLIDKVEKVEYGKQDHPKLDLQSISFKDYLRLTMNETKKGSSKAKVRTRPNPVFDSTHSKVNDNKDHFPLGNANQARNALARVAQYTSKPKWYNGTLESLKNAVKRAVHKEYPLIEISD